MHTTEVPESEGTFTRQLPARVCACGGTMHGALWESHCGGYEDEKYTCSLCKRVVWVEGPDS